MTQHTSELLEKLISAQVADCTSRGEKDPVATGYARALGNIQSVLKYATTTAEVDAEIELVIKYLHANISARENLNKKSENNS